MRWLVFAIFAYVLCSADAGLAPLLRFDSPAGYLLPSLTFVLGVYVSLWAGPTAAHWSMFVLGALVDLQPLPFPDPESSQSLGHASQTFILGPHALGFLAASYVVVQIRNMLNRDSALALAATVFAAGLFACVVRVVLLSLRAWPLMQPLDNWSGINELFLGFLRLLYSTVAAIPLGFILGKSQPLWGFETSRAFHRRI